MLPRLLTELRLRSALEAAIVNTMTLVCPNLSPIPSLMDLLAFMIAFILLRFGHTRIAFSGQSIFQSNEECNCFQTWKSCIIQGLRVFLSPESLSISVHFLKIFPSHTRPHFSFSKQFYQHGADIVNIQDCSYTTTARLEFITMFLWRRYLMIIWIMNNNIQSISV